MNKKNVEIKAKVPNIFELIEKVHKLPNVKFVGVLHQTDIFYHCEKGKLKLRHVIQDGKGYSQLVYYNREKELDGKMTSHIKLLDVTDFEGLNNILSASNNVIGTICKKRILYMLGRTRIHLDDVDDLGTYMELEVVMNPDDDKQAGEIEANSIMEMLGIKEDQLFTNAYIDLLMKSKSVGLRIGTMERNIDIEEYVRKL